MTQRAPLFIAQKTTEQIADASGKLNRLARTRFIGGKGVKRTGKFRKISRKVNRPGLTITVQNTRSYAHGTVSCNSQDDLRGRREDVQCV